MSVCKVVCSNIQCMQLMTVYYTSLHLSGKQLSITGGQFECRLNQYMIVFVNGKCSSTQCVQVYFQQCIYCLSGTMKTLNQACAGLQPARTWFLDIDLVRKVCVCVRVSVRPPPKASNNQWHDVT